MSEAIASVAQAALQQVKDVQNVKTQNQDGGAKRSFDQVLQQQQQQTEMPPTNNQPPMKTGVSGAGMDAKLQQLQSNLTQRVNDINPTDKVPTSKGDILPDLFYNKTRMSLLKEAAASIKQSPQGADMLGRFSQLERESNQIEGIMKSSKDLSPGELLGLQARLYQVSQHIEVMSKVVDQVTGGIKTILNTNV